MFKESISSISSIIFCLQIDTVVLSVTTDEQIARHVSSYGDQLAVVFFRNHQNLGARKIKSKMKGGLDTYQLCCTKGDRIVTIRNLNLTQSIIFDRLCLFLSTSNMACRSAFSMWIPDCSCRFAFLKKKKKISYILIHNGSDPDV